MYIYIYSIYIYIYIYMYIFFSLTLQSVTPRTALPWMAYDPLCSRHSAYFFSRIEKINNATAVAGRVNQFWSPLLDAMIDTMS